MDAIRPGLALNATEQRISLRATRPLTAGGGEGGQPHLFSRGAHIELNREAKSPACSTVGRSRGGGAVDVIRLGLASNATEQRILLRATRLLTAGEEVINRIWIQGGPTLNPTTKLTPPPASRRVVVEGGITVDIIRPGLASNTTERRILLRATRSLIAGGAGINRIGSPGGRTSNPTANVI